MIKELKYVFYLIVIFFFIFFVTSFYFSDEYKKISYRSISLIDNKIGKISESLPILYSDTDDIIEYADHQKNQKKDKYFFWELLNND